MDSIKGKRGEHTLCRKIIYNEKYFSFPVRNTFEKGTRNGSIRLFELLFFFQKCVLIIFFSSAFLNTLNGDAVCK